MQIKNILKSTLFLSLGSVAEKVVGFILVPILTKELNPESYGALLLSYSICGFLSLLYISGLPSALFLRLTQTSSETEKKKIEKLILLVILLFGAIVFFLFFLAEKKFNIITNLKIDFLVLVTVYFGTIITSFLGVKAVVWNITNKNHLTAIYSMIRFTLIGILTVIILKLFPYQATKPLIELGIGILIIIPTTYTYIFKYPKINFIEFKNRLETIKSSIKYGWEIQITQIAFLIIISSDRLMISYFLENKYVAIYSVGMIGINLVVFATAFTNAMTPDFFKMINSGVSDAIIHSTILKMLKYTLVYYIAIKLGVIVLGNYFIDFMAGDNYEESKLIFQFVPEIILFYTGYLIISRFFHAKEHTRILVIITLISAVINLILNYSLIERVGILGALISSILSYIFLFMISTIKLTKLIGGSIKLNRFGGYVVLILLFLNIICLWQLN